MSATLMSDGRVLDDLDRDWNDRSQQSMAAAKLDQVFAAAWAKAGGVEAERKSEHAARRVDVLPGGPVPEIPGMSPFRAVDVILGGGKLAVEYIRLGPGGHAVRDARSKFYHPDYGSVPAVRYARLTRRPYQSGVR